MKSVWHAPERRYSDEHGYYYYYVYSTREAFSDSRPVYRWSWCHHVWERVALL